MKLYKVAYYRKMLGEKQEDFAKLLGVARTTYSGKEQGRIAITIDEATILRDHINEKIKTETLTLDELFCTQKVS